MDTVTLPVMTCSAETWALTKHQEKQLAGVKRRLEKSLLNITKRERERQDSE